MRSAGVMRNVGGKPTIVESTKPAVDKPRRAEDDSRDGGGRAMQDAKAEPEASSAATPVKKNSKSGDKK